MGRTLRGAPKTKMA